MKKSSRISPQLVETIRRKARVELARRDPDAFCEYVLKDDKGLPVKQSAIHREINNHIDECRKRGINCGILAPWRHGKTEQVVIARSLQFLGENSNNRVAIVCSSDSNAAARVESISKYIKDDVQYREVYPSIVPGNNTDWGKHKLIVRRESKSKDGSVEAWGIGTSGAGSGCDFLITDDPVDLRNAILNPALREQVKESFRNVWSSRLSPTGFKIYIATIWHNDDLTSELLVNPEWCFLILKVSKDFSRFDCVSPLKGAFTLPLWEEAWNKQRLMQKCSEIGIRAFNRGFRQEAMSDEDKTFPSSEMIFREDLRASDIVQPHFPRILGIDPFGQWVVIFTLTLNANTKQRIPTKIRRGKWDTKRTVSEILRAYEEDRPQLIVVENNAAQDAIIQWCKEKGGHDLSGIIVPFTTGKQKADPILGLPSIDIEFENGSWIVPMNGKHVQDCKCGFCVWRNELYNHPVAVACDTVMASWFAREGARFLIAKSEEPPPPSGELITQEEMGIEPVVIGDY